MFIREMTEAECVTVVASGRLARLACSKNDQPYVVPNHYAYAGRCLYSFSMPGRKIEWMRVNPHVCVQVDAFSCFSTGDIRSFRRRRNGITNACTPGHFSRNMSIGGSLAD